MEILYVIGSSAAWYGIYMHAYVLSTYVYIGCIGVLCVYVVASICVDVYAYMYRKTRVYI